MDMTSINAQTKQLNDSGELRLVIAAQFNYPIFKNKSQKAEVKTTFVCDQTFLMVLYMEPST